MNAHTRGKFKFDINNRIVAKILYKESEQVQGRKGKYTAVYFITNVF